MMDE
jgi:hypothetical protein